MSEPKTQASVKKDIRPTSIGGQAVIEGVMMRGQKMYAMAVRKPDHGIELVEKDLNPVSDHYPVLKLPILRGIIAFVDSLKLGLTIITSSAEIAGLDDIDEPKGSFELFLEEKLGERLNDVLMGISMVLAVALSAGLFMLLPVWLGSFFSGFLNGSFMLLGAVEGILRIGIFILYIVLISRSREMRRVFQYHGAEHKTINCFESGQELTVENAGKHTRLHKRCGTSFLIFVMLISMLVFIFVRTNVLWLRFASRLILVPVIAGVSYEVIRWAGRSDSSLVRVISFPGLCLQRLTTAEPDDDQLEVAIAAMKGVLAHEPA